MNYSVKNRKIIFLLILALVFGFAVFISIRIFNTSLFDKVLPSDPQVTTGVLDNGLRYYIRANGKPQKTAVLRLVVNAGSVAEEDDQRGFAHFNEHLSFNGTKNFPCRSLIEYFEAAGMKFGNEINAYTSFDETVYELTVPLSNDEYLDKGLLALYDWACATSSSDSEIDAERGVIHEEFRTRYDVQGRLFSRSLPVVLYNSKYPLREVIGTYQCIDSGSAEAIRRFRDEWYRPEIQAVVVVGDFDKADVEQKVINLFSKIPVSKEQKKQYIPDIPDHEETLVSVNVDKEQTGTEVLILYKHPYKAVKTVNDYRNSLLIAIYNQLLNNRFNEMTALDGGELPVFSANSFYSRVAGGKSIYGVGCSAKNERVNEAIIYLLRESRKATLYGFSEEELERVKKKLENDINEVYNNRNNQESDGLARKYVSNFIIDHSPFMDPEYEYNLYKKLLNKVKTGDIDKTGKRLATNTNRVVVINAPERDTASLPDKKDILRVLKRAGSEKVSRNLCQPVIKKELLKEKPKPGKVVSEKTIAGIPDLTEWTLSNGVKVYLKPTAYKNDQIFMGGISYGGTSLYSNEDLFSAELSTEIIANAGIGELDPSELNRILTGKSVQVRLAINSLSEAIGGNSSNEGLEAMLSLTYLYFSSPRESEERYNSYVDKLKLKLQNKYLNPMETWYDTISSVMTSGNPRIRPVSVARIDELSYSKVYKIYRERYANAGDFRFIFVGSFNKEEIRPLIETYIGGLPGKPGEKESWTDLKIKPEQGRVDHYLYTSNEDKSYVLMEFGSEIEYNLKNCITARLLGTILSNTLLVNIREKLGGVYTIQAIPRITRYPGERIGYTIQFVCDPGRVDELKKEIIKEITRLSKTGVSVKDLEVCVNQARRELEVARKTNDYWMGTIQELLFNNDDIREFGNYSSILMAITPLEIKNMAEKVFDMGQYKIFSFMPARK